MKFLAKYRMYFLRVSILLLIVLSVTNNDFRAYTLEITTIESLQMSILGFVLVVFGSFGISVKDESGYVNVGSVGTGFSQMDLIKLTTDLKKIVDKYDKDIFYVLPRIVLEVTCDLISQDTDGNFGLRFPRLVKIRDDKFPADINTLEDVRSNI